VVAHNFNSSTFPLNEGFSAQFFVFLENNSDKRIFRQAKIHAAAMPYAPLQEALHIAELGKLTVYGVNWRLPL